MVNPVQQQNNRAEVYDPVWDAHDPVWGTPKDFLLEDLDFLRALSKYPSEVWSAMEETGHEFKHIASVIEEAGRDLRDAATQYPPVVWSVIKETARDWKNSAKGSFAWDAYVICSILDEEATYGRKGRVSLRETDIYKAAAKRMEERWELAKSFNKKFEDADGSKRLEAITRGIGTLVGPGEDTLKDALEKTFGPQGNIGGNLNPKIKTAPTARKAKTGAAAGRATATGSTHALEAESQGHLDPQLEKIFKTAHTGEEFLTKLSAFYQSSEGSPDGNNRLETQAKNYFESILFLSD